MLRSRAAILKAPSRRDARSVSKSCNRCRDAWPLAGSAISAMPCRLGRSGLTSSKREGDGATPDRTLAAAPGAVPARPGRPPAHPPAPQARSPARTAGATRPTTAITTGRCACPTPQAMKGCGATTISTTSSSCFRTMNVRAGASMVVPFSFTLPIATASRPPAASRCRSRDMTRLAGALRAAKPQSRPVLPRPENRRADPTWVAPQAIAAS